MGSSLAHTRSPWGLGSALQHTLRTGPNCQNGVPARLHPRLGSRRPREHPGAGSSPLSQRQLMLMQRPLLQVNCVRGKQVG